MCLESTDHVLSYLSLNATSAEHGPVNKFLDEGTREVKWSETTPPKPYVVDWKIRPVDVINPFLPADTKPEVIFYNWSLM